MNNEKQKHGQEFSTAYPEKSDKTLKNPDATHPPVSDPPVPNRAHTEMRTEFPPEFPSAPKKEF